MDWGSLVGTVAGAFGSGETEKSTGGNGMSYSLQSDTKNDNYAPAHSGTSGGSFQVNAGGLGLDRMTPIQLGIAVLGIVLLAGIAAYAVRG